MARHGALCLWRCVGAIGAKERKKTSEWRASVVGLRAVNVTLFSSSMGGPSSNATC